MDKKPMNIACPFETNLMVIVTEPETREGNLTQVTFWAKKPAQYEKNGDMHWKKEPDYYPCKLLGDVADKAQELAKGDKIVADGKLTGRTYESKNWGTKYEFKFMINEYTIKEKAEPEVDSVDEFQAAIEEMGAEEIKVEGDTEQTITSGEVEEEPEEEVKQEDELHKIPL